MFPHSKCLNFFFTFRRQKKLTYVPERMVETYPLMARMAAKHVGKEGQYDHEKVINQCRVAFQRHTVTRDRKRKQDMDLSPSKRRKVTEGFSTSDDEPGEELRQDYDNMELSLLHLTSFMDQTLQGNAPDSSPAGNS